MKLTAAIPCRDAAALLPGAIGSVRAQTLPAGRLLVVDDGSSDGSGEVARALGAEVIPLGRRLGRGAARQAAVRAAGEGLLLFCDAGCRLPPDFAEKASARFSEERLAAVFGPVVQGEPGNAAERWRGRHLLKQGASSAGVARGASLITTGCVIRLAAAERVGGFDPGLVAGEDADLGARLLAAGFDVACDPALAVTTVKKENVASVLDRYARWNTGGKIGAAGYLRLVVYSAKVMARQDLAAGDLAAAWISLLCPHYQMLWSRRRGWRRGEGGGGA